jgi:SAM-dependent methyltransferase
VLRAQKGDNMQAYTGFAQVYDTFMDNIPYDKWSEYLTDLLKKYNITDGLILDLGCGTGSITERLAKKGYDMIGIDNSEEMLSIALEKLSENLSDEDIEEGSSNILYLLQDMREFELYGTVKAVVSICDSMNYILSEEDLIKVFSLVNNYLDTDGVFIFDMNTEYKYEKVLADNTIAENREDASFIWDNFYDEEQKLNEYDLTIYVKEEDNLFARFDETHYQKAYSLETMKDIIEKAGMEYVTAYDAFTYDEPKKNSERIYIVAKEKRQEKKYYTDK